MFLGHFAVALAAKRAAPQVSLGTTFLAAQWLDLLWPTLLLLGLERVRIEPGATAVTPLVFEHYPISHSLTAVVGWALLFAVLHFVLARQARAATIVGLLVASHWLLDLLVHVPDLPLAPAGEMLWGLGLWNSRAATLALELALFGAGAWIYARCTTAANSKGRWGFLGLLALLLVIYAVNFWGPPPQRVQDIAWVGQAQWLLVLFGWWVDRHRMPARR